MPLITVYYGVSDFPKGVYVARIFDLDRGTDFYITRSSLEEIREAIPYSFNGLIPSEEDDPVIVEVWL